MDILDLSVGEKSRSSRRKAFAPQRRQVLTENVRDGALKTYSEIEATPNEAEGPVPRTILLEHSSRLNKDYLPLEADNYSSSTEIPNRAPFEEERDVQDDNNCAVLSLGATPSNHGSDDRCLDEVRTPSPHASLASNEKSQENNLGLSYFSNSNQNNNIVLYRSTVQPQANRSEEHSDQAMQQAILPSIQERLEALTSRFFPTTMDISTRSVSNSTALGNYGDDVRPTDAPEIPERTKKQNRWAFNVWREWARKRNLTSEGLTGTLGRVPLDVGKATEAELDYWLSKFVQEIRRKDGNTYPSHTLMQIVMGIQRYLRQQAGRPSICILDRSNVTFSRFRAALDSRIKELTNEATISHKIRRRSILSSNGPHSSNSSSNYPEQSVLWNAGVIGTDTALRLLNGVFYHNTVTFGIRVIDDHWNLRMSHFSVGNRGQQSQSYVEFIPSRDSHYVNRGLTKDRRVYAEPGNPRCVVKLFQKYISLVPPDGAFYRHPQEPTLVDRSIRFSDQWVGKNRLRAMIKHVFDSTRLDGVERGHNALPSTSHKHATKKCNLLDQQQESNVLYDRIAQVMYRLSHMQQSPHHLQMSDIPSSNATSPSPKIETSRPSSVTCQEEVTSKQSNGLIETQAPEIEAVKQEGLYYETPAKAIRLDDGMELDEVKVTSSCEKQVEESMLEIAVPQAITAVTILKGSRRLTIQLD